MIEYQTEEQIEMIQAKGFLVKVIGVGGAGSNVLDQIALDGMEDAELICLNTDVRTLKTSTAHSKVQIGKQLTRGLGAGGDPELGILAAEEAEEEIRAAVRGQDMIFICTGLGGGTGSGAAPTVSRIAKEEGAFVVVFATMPFSFEGRRRIQQAETALKLLERSADALITFENDRMGELVLPKEGIQQAFGNADKIISQSVRAITYVVTQPGLIQIGMDDLLTALKTPVSRCLFGYGLAKGKNRAQEALKTALRSPLLDRGKLLGKSRNVLVHIVGGGSMTLYEVELLMNEMSKNVGNETQILFGAATDEKMGDELSVTIISSLTLDELRQHEASMVSERSDFSEVVASTALVEDSSSDDDTSSIEEARRAEKEALEKARAKREEEEATKRRDSEAADAKAREEAEARAQADREKELAEQREAEAAQTEAEAEERSKKEAAERQEEALAKAAVQAPQADEESEDDRARREAFERRRAELKKAADGPTPIEPPASVKPATPKPRPDAEDLMEQRRRAQEELERKRGELEKLLKMEEEARRKRPVSNAAPPAVAPPLVPKTTPEASALDLDDESQDEGMEPTERVTVGSKGQAKPPMRKPGRAPLPPAKPLSPKPEAPVARTAAPVEEEDPLKAKRMSTQEELQLEPLRGRFEKAAPTVIDGENLDVPTFSGNAGRKARHISKMFSLESSTLSARVTEVSAPYEVLLYYRYFPIAEPTAYVAEHRALCEKLGLLGRVLIAEEGINGTLSGLAENTRAYREHLQTQPGTDTMEFKIDPADDHVFAKLSIKMRSEIVTLGLPEENDVDPNETTGEYLSPKDFYEAMQDPNAVIIDARNDYESQLGKFRNAICPQVDSFRELPQWIRDHRAMLEGKRILTYCTGGIRCEKFSGFLIDEGFADVSQLHGGIVTYGRDPEIQGRDFDGQCYVFDQRIGVPVNQANPRVIAHCKHCGDPVERFRNCGYCPCNAQFFCCPDCEERRGRFCSDDCREAQGRVEVSSQVGDSE